MVIDEPSATATSPGAQPVLGIAFLLAQLGAYGANRFAERAAPLGISPAQSGLLRAIASSPGRSQQAVAEQLGLKPSRLVVLIDELESEGLVERRRNPNDRRHYALHLTKKGERLLAKIARVAAEHEADICAPLTGSERARLKTLLGKLAEHHSLAPGVHPGYRRI